MPKPNGITGAIDAVLDTLKEIEDGGIRFVPATPTPTMTVAGARAAGIPEADAARIYRAMIEADKFDDDRMKTVN